MREAATATAPELTWPSAYQGLLPVLTEHWQVEGEVYLRQQLGAGKSGALVYIVDITCAGYSGQAILKLDRAPDPSWQEEPEADRHQKALEVAPDFAAKHLPRVLHTLRQDDRIAILSTIVARGLEYSVAWMESSYRAALGSLQDLSRGLLEEWNADYRLADGMVMPQELLLSWLGYRIQPNEGRIDGYLADVCGFAPSEPSFVFEGHWYPNPLAFSRDVIALPARLRLRAVQGRLHGDLHGFNVLVNARTDAAPEYFLIDLALYQEQQFLFYDHAYSEVALLLANRDAAPPARWNALLDHISLFHHLSHAEDVWHDDVGITEDVHVLRREAMDWVERHESHRLSFMESQYLLARVAAGLNFTNKSLSEEARYRAFVYAAANLKDYIKLNGLEWPKYGPLLSLRGDPTANSADSAPQQPEAPGARPPPEKDRLAQRIENHLPQPQKPVIAVMPFESLSGDPADMPFVDAITHEIIAELSRVDWLGVIAPGSTFALRNETINTGDLGPLLGAHYKVEGSVLRSGDQVRVTAHLVDIANHQDLWAGRFKHKVEDIFALQEEIAASVAGNIDWELKFDQRERARLKRGEVSVWDRVQKALWHLMKFTDDDTAKAKEILAKTVELTPGYAFAHATMAFAELRKVNFGESDDPEAAKARALEHAKEAVSHEGQNSFARAMLARAYSSLGRHDEALSEAETAVALNPSSANAYLVLGTVLLSSGRSGEALPHLESALRLSPAGPYQKLKYLCKAYCLYRLGELEDAEATVRQAQEGAAVGPFGKFLLGAILARQGRMEEARQAIEEGRKIRPDITVTTMRDALDYQDKGDLEAFAEDLHKAGLKD